MYHTILFDLDGTLTDSGLGITNAVAYALRRCGIEEKDLNVLRKFVGPSAAPERFLCEILWLFACRVRRGHRLLQRVLHKNRYL